MDGEFILDLSLPPPPGIALGTNRKNLTLHTTSGRVTAEIWTRQNGSVESNRVSLDLCSGNGPVRAIVARLSLSILASSLVEMGFIHHSTTFFPPIGAAAHVHSSTWSCVLTMEMYTSRFPVAFMGQSPSAPMMTESPFLVRLESVRL